MILRARNNAANLNPGAYIIYEHQMSPISASSDSSRRQNISVGGEGVFLNVQRLPSLPATAQA